MKQLQHVTTFSLIIALTVLSPVVAADSGKISDDEGIQPDQRPFDSPLSYHLSLEQMDGIHAGNRPAGCAEPTGRNNGERQRSGKPECVNTSCRSGQPDAVNTHGRSGDRNLSTARNAQYHSDRR